MDLEKQKRRHPLRTEWSSLRVAIMQYLQKEQIRSTEFRPLSIHEHWMEIEDNIYQKFCKLSHYKERPFWLWTCFKLEYFSIHDMDVLPETLLDSLMDAQETVWYLVNETIQEREKFWFYEGKVKTIQKVIEECGFDELYIVSKKYEWLICINHHDDLIATGPIMVEKLRCLKSVLDTIPNPNPKIIKI